MPNSKVDERYDFNPDKWVISLINTKGGTSGIMAGPDDVFKTGYKASREEQYTEATSKSWFVTPDAAMTMINDILDEKHARGEYATQEKNFQYAGIWCIYSYRGGHNCTTWAEEKLGKAGVGNGRVPIDKIKAMPSAHVTCSLQ